jgi:hypothetical protein
VVAWSQAWTVFVPFVDSNPSRVMNVCVRLFCVCVVVWVVSGLETDWSPVQGRPIFTGHVLMLFTLMQYKPEPYFTWILVTYRIYQELFEVASRSWALLEKPLLVQLLKNFPAFYRNRRFIVVFTRALLWSVSWDRSIQSVPNHPISLRYISILSTRLVFQVVSFILTLPPISHMHYSSQQFVLNTLPTSSSLTWWF